jgi:hypothetical protein
MQNRSWATDLIVEQAASDCIPPPHVALAAGLRLVRRANNMHIGSIPFLRERHNFLRSSSGRRRSSQQASFVLPEERFRLAVETVNSSGVKGQWPRSAITRYRAFRYRLPTGAAHGFPGSGRCQ